MVHNQKIAILFPAFLGGGAEAVCLWILESLKEEYELTLFTFSNINFQLLNKYYGTQILDAQIRVVRPFFRAGFPHYITDSYSLFALRQHLLIRYFKNTGRKFDLSISAFNEMDMGSPGIQYIHFPMFGRGHEAVRSIVGYPDSKIRRFYRNICRMISGFSENHMRENLTIANSQWTASIVKQIYDIDARVIYPPVISDFPDIPWEERENGFVIIGRFVPEKKIERAIRILQMVRTRGYDVHVHIIGGGGDPKYQEYIQKLRDENASWVFLEKGLSRKDLCKMLATHKYGIHTRENEQFGIVVAEKVKAGCIPFVPAKGGQVEIIGESKWLTFNDEQEAVKKIETVLSNTETQNRLRHILAEKASLFSLGRFKVEIRKVVKEFF